MPIPAGQIGKSGPRCPAGTWDRTSSPARSSTTPAGTSTSPTSTGPAVLVTGARPIRPTGPTATDRPLPPRGPKDPRDLKDETVRPGTGWLPTPPDQGRRTSARRPGRSVPAAPTGSTRQTARLAGTRATPGPRSMASQSPDQTGGLAPVAGAGTARRERPVRPRPGESSPDTSRLRITTPPALAPATSRQPTGRRFTGRRFTSRPFTSRPFMSGPAMSRRAGGSLCRLRVRRGRSDRE